ncbi:ATP-binding protein [Chrysiogenes arsenatis]|uniref:ATP-binding protein n=1 Tax=Chrysiogenes arsenatis TaxID=309797 RepID=UPI0004161666|nr:ATP-binding protein [Chrysiogenes arsenatis]
MDKTLKKNLILFYLLFTVIIVSTVWVSLYFIMNQLAEKSVDVRLSEAKVHAYRIQSKIEELMTSYDIRRLNTSDSTYRNLHSAMDEIIRANEEIVYALIIETNGLVVIHSDRKREGLLFDDRMTVNALRSGFPLVQSGLIDGAGYSVEGYDISLPIYYGATKVGVFRLGVSSALMRDSLKEEIQTLFQKHSIVFFVILTALFLLFIFMVNQINRVRTLQRRVSANEKLAYIGSVSGSLAHEIKNPLNAINLNIQLLQEDLEEETLEREEALASCQVIGAEVQRLNELLNEFLAYARMTSPTLKKDSIGRILGGVCDLFRPQCAAKGIQLEVERTAKSDTLFLDRNQIRQVLINLVKNGIEALGDTPQGSITIRHYTKQRHHHIEVIDNGPGISYENQKKIFDIFFSTKTDGTGLGLPIARNIIEAHGGQLTLRSAPGKGTTVQIILPDTEDGYAK